MPSISQILSYVDRKYPNSETTANKVLDLNDIHRNIYVRLARLKNDHEPFEDVTIANQLTYVLPSNCNADNIITIKVSQTTTITSSTEWDTFKFAGVNDDTTEGNWWGHAGNGIYSLLKDDEPIDTSGLSIRIFYFRRPNALTSDNLSAIPELDEDYHDLLKYGLIQALASQGHNPDTEIADYWQRKYDELMQEVISNISERLDRTPTRSCQATEDWS